MQRIVIILTLTLFSLNSFSQIEQLKKTCSTNFPSYYISDGQEYFAALKPDQRIEFRTTFYADNTYRISACTNAKKGKLVFKVYDTEKNLLFTNESFNYSPFWDFRFTSTVTCIIQVEVKNPQFIPGYVMLLIGFKP
jgi:hypothetical protein